MPLLQIIFFLLSHFEIQELFAHLLYHSTLFFILTKAAFHLASSSCRNFVTMQIIELQVLKRGKLYYENMGVLLKYTVYAPY